MEMIILTAVLCSANIVCFCAGAKIGQTVSKGDDIKVPNPVRMMEAYRESTELKEEQHILEINRENIDNYNGTDLGQRDFR